MTRQTFRLCLGALSFLFCRSYATLVTLPDVLLLRKDSWCEITSNQTLQVSCVQPAYGHPYFRRIFFDCRHRNGIILFDESSLSSHHIVYANRYNANARTVLFELSTIKDYKSSLDVTIDWYADMIIVLYKTTLDPASHGNLAEIKLLALHSNDVFMRKKTPRSCLISIVHAVNHETMKTPNYDTVNHGSLKRLMYHPAIRSTVMILTHMIYLVQHRDSIDDSSFNSTIRVVVVDFDIPMKSFAITDVDWLSRDIMIKVVPTNQDRVTIKKCEHENNGNDSADCVVEEKSNYEIYFVKLREDTLARFNGKTHLSPDHVLRIPNNCTGGVTVDLYTMRTYTSLYYKSSLPRLTPTTNERFSFGPKYFISTNRIARETLIQNVEGKKLKNGNQIVIHEDIEDILAIDKGSSDYCFGEYLFFVGRRRCIRWYLYTGFFPLFYRRDTKGRRRERRGIRTRRRSVDVV